jgi:hypothetical protein
MDKKKKEYVLITGPYKMFNDLMNDENAKKYEACGSMTSTIVIKKDYYDDYLFGNKTEIIYSQLLKLNPCK